VSSTDNTDNNEDGVKSLDVSKYKDFMKNSVMPEKKYTIIDENKKLNTQLSDKAKVDLVK